MAATTIKLSTETRDRLKALDRPTYEDAVIEALDLLEAEDFWRQADEALVRFEQLPSDVKVRYAAESEAIDRDFGGLR